MHIPIKHIAAQFWGVQVLYKACSELHTWRVDGKESRVVRKLPKSSPTTAICPESSTWVTPRDYVCISAGWRADHQELNHFEKGGSNLLDNNLTEVTSP